MSKGSMIIASLYSAHAQPEEGPAERGKRGECQKDALGKGQRTSHQGGHRRGKQGWCQKDALDKGQETLQGKRLPERTRELKTRPPGRFIFFFFQAGRFFFSSGTSLRV